MPTLQGLTTSLVQCRAMNPALILMMSTEDFKPLKHEGEDTATCISVDEQRFR